MDKQSIELRNIDLSKISIGEQLLKVQEENVEFFEACKEYISKTLFDDISKKEIKQLKEHVIEEFWDTVQSKIGYMDKINISVEEITAGYIKHLEKMENRGNKPR